MNIFLSRALSFSLLLGGAAAVTNYLGCNSPDEEKPKRCTFEGKNGEKNDCTFTLKASGDVQIDRYSFLEPLPKPNLNLLNPNWKMYPELCHSQRFTSDNKIGSYTFYPPQKGDEPNSTPISTADIKGSFKRREVSNRFPLLSCGNNSDPDFLFDPIKEEFHPIYLSDLPLLIRQQLALSQEVFLDIFSDPYQSNSTNAFVPFQIFDSSMKQKLISMGVAKIDFIQSKGIISKIVKIETPSFDLSAYQNLETQYQVEKEKMIFSLKGRYLSNSSISPHLYSLTIFDLAEEKFIASFKLPEKPIYASGERTIEGTFFDQWKNYLEENSIFHLSPDGNEIWILHTPYLNPEKIPEDQRNKIHPQFANSTFLRYDLKNNGADLGTKRISSFYAPIDFQFLKDEKQVVLLGIKEMIPNSSVDNSFKWLNPLKGKPGLLLLDQQLNPLQNIFVTNEEPIQLLFDYTDRQNKTSPTERSKYFYHNRNYAPYNQILENGKKITILDKDRKNLFEYLYQNGNFFLSKTIPFYFSRLEIQRAYQVLEDPRVNQYQIRFDYMGENLTSYGLSLYIGANRELVLVNGNQEDESYILQIPSDEKTDNSFRSRPCYFFPLSSRRGASTENETWSRLVSCSVEFGTPAAYQDWRGILHLLIPYGNTVFSTSVSLSN